MGLLNDQYFADNFNTSLNPDEEKAFQQWAQANPRLGSTEDYDARGFWKAGAGQAANGHGSDQWKKPNHPTFSDQSMYSGLLAPWGGQFQGGKWSEANGQMSYTPSYEMLKNTHPLNWLRGYMQQVEPDVNLSMDYKK